MKNIFTIIGAVVICLSLLTVGVFALQTPDYKGEVSAYLEQAHEARVKAKDSNCKYIGDLTASCYKHDKVACTRLTEAEEDFKANFEADAYNDCFNNEPAPAVSAQSSSTDPLFFGDEE